MVQSRCGLLCRECSFRDACNCGGCIETGGHPFHGECPIALCCQTRGFEHCGLCPDLPCEGLYAYSYLDKEHGDNPPGARIEQLKRWAEDPYEKCPALETPSFLLRLVSPDDAEDLLSCYSDPKSQDILDSENCTSDFRYSTVEEMLECIQFWLREYGQRVYVRFAVVDKRIKKPIGTVEMFGAKGFLADYDGGILRVDLASRYETAAYISELLALASDRFYDLFGVDVIAAKGRDGEVERVSALLAAGYHPYDWKSPDREHYYRRFK